MLPAIPFALFGLYCEFYENLFTRFSVMFLTSKQRNQHTKRDENTTIAVGAGNKDTWKYNFTIIHVCFLDAVLHLVYVQEMHIQLIAIQYMLLSAFDADICFKISQKEYKEFYLYHAMKSRCFRNKDWMQQPNIADDGGRQTGLESNFVGCCADP